MHIYSAYNQNYTSSKIRLYNFLSKHIDIKIAYHIQSIICQIDTNAMYTYFIVGDTQEHIIYNIPHNPTSEPSDDAWEPSDCGVGFGFHFNTF